jgi:predicted transcriptional regulator
MNIPLTSAQELRLGRLAAETDRSAEEIAREVLESYLRHVDALAAAVREGEESAERAGWLTHDEVFERLNQRLLKTA